MKQLFNRDTVNELAKNPLVPHLYNPLGYLFLEKDTKSQPNPAPFSKVHLY